MKFYASSFSIQRLILILVVAVVAVVLWSALFSFADDFLREETTQNNVTAVFPPVRFSSEDLKWVGPSPFPVAHIETAAGALTMVLLRKAAPRTVANFIRLASDGFYNGTSFYRYEKSVLLQGGGLKRKESPYPPIALEYRLASRKHYVCMARSIRPDSATSELMIMLQDNSHWMDPGTSDPYGFAVFAKVVQGLQSVMEVVGRIPTVVEGMTYLRPPLEIYGVTVKEYV